MTKAIAADHVGSTTAAAGSTSGPTLKRRRTQAESRGRYGWVLLAPFAATFVLFLIVPLAYALWLSLHSRSITGSQNWAGFDNYIRVFSDSSFLGGLGRVLLYGVLQAPIMLVLALVLALMLDAVTTRLSRLSRIVAFMPYAVPAVIGVLMWGFLYSPQLGPASILTALFGDAAPDLLGSNLVLYSLVNIVTWQMTGYNMIIIYAALQGLPREIYEAARIDGAGGWKLATQIKLPLVAPAVVLSTVFTIIATLQLFSEPKVLQSTRPDAVPADFTPNMYAYNQAFAYGQFNYAATISFVLGVVIIIGSYIFLYVTRRRSGLHD
ncbi:sugar ABC transporter permease [Ruania alkalisoli]|uniref:Sugar ABC transporter permease n=1 Tax=Ruania alkalisoli TaxID=2779775 RepID=A0A7M1SVW4_9MICO|nr:sugar ABC transporter permease [Ruania alkalisoli]QOR70892.1 sugar ABC transporter permease [Ruania alkalisoli]